MQIIILCLTHVESIFKDHDAYETTYDCYQQDLPVIEYGHNVTMLADVSRNNLMLIWTVTINGYTAVIDKHNDLYLLGAQNKVVLAMILMLIITANCSHSVV